MAWCQCALEQGWELLQFLNILESSPGVVCEWS
uniref:Uncharacterized protein n=1 Tax=Anguilla anguilla TaxID=7936 RepID=A0A0E9XQM7_ANGAN